MRDPNPIRLGVLNNYSFQRVRREVREGKKPDHALYGLNHLEGDGFTVELAPDCETPRPRGLWDRPLRWLDRIVPLGDLRQQMWVLKNRGRLDAIFEPCQTQTLLLCYLRALGLFRLPIVKLAHHPLETAGRLHWLKHLLVLLQLKGVDAFPSHNSLVAGQINRLAGNERFSEFLPWGPDTGYYPPAVYPGKGAVAAGRTLRDFGTFAEAASRAGVPASVFCLQADAGRLPKGLGRNVTIRSLERESDLNYAALGPLFANARVLAIPLLGTGTLSGLTSLVDAIGAGKPVIMTRHPMIDLDIEKEGIGRWVEVGDVDGWERHLAWFEAHPDEAAEMGRRARLLVERGPWNSVEFARRIGTILRRATKRP